MRQTATSIVLSFAALNTLLWLVLYASGLVEASENGGLENAQAVCLFLAGATFAASAFRQTASPDRLLLLGLSLLCWTCLLRELELDDLNAPRMITQLGTTTGRIAFLGPFWLLIVGMAFNRFGAIRESAQRFRRSHSGQLFGLGVLCYLLSWPLDQGKVSLAYQRATAIEEFLDLLACTLILASAVLVVCDCRRARRADGSGRASTEQTFLIDPRQERRPGVHITLSRRIK